MAIVLLLSDPCSLVSDPTPQSGLEQNFSLFGQPECQPIFLHSIYLTKLFVRFDQLQSWPFIRNRTDTDRCLVWWQTRTCLVWRQTQTSPWYDITQESLLSSPAQPSPQVTAGAVSSLHTSLLMGCSSPAVWSLYSTVQYSTKQYSTHSHCVHCKKNSLGPDRSLMVRQMLSCVCNVTT